MPQALVLGLVDFHAQVLQLAAHVQARSGLVLAHATGEGDDVHAVHLGHIGADVLEDAQFIHVEGELRLGVAMLGGVHDFAHVARDSGHAQHAALLVHDANHLLGGDAILVHDVEQCSGIHIAHACAHHQSLGGGEAHGGVDALAAHDGADAGAVANVAAHDFLLLIVHTEHLAHAARDKAVAGAVEAVAAHVVLAVVLLGQCIAVGGSRHGLVERGVEHGDLGHVGQNGVDGLDAGHVHRIVKRRDAIALTNHGFHLGGDEHALAEFLAAMHHAVTHGVDFVETLDAAVVGVSEHVEDSLDGALVVGDVQVDVLLGTVVKFQFDECVGQTDFLHAAFGQRLVLLDFNQFVFCGATAAVQH